MLEWKWGGKKSSAPPQSQGSAPSDLGGCGLACAFMCAAYMLTGMSGLDEVALPITPGAVYKMQDVALKHRVWKSWGLEGAAMRT